MINLAKKLNISTGFFSLAFPVYFLALATLFNTYLGYQPETETYKPAVSALDVSLGSNSPICSGTTLQLTSTVTNASGPFSYVWSGPAQFTSGVANPFRQNTVVTHSGNYMVTVTQISSGMTGVASISVTVNQSATVNAGPDQQKCKGASVVLNGAFGGSASTAFWTASVPGGLFSPNNTTLNAQYSPPPNFTGNITITLTTDDPPGLCPAAVDALEVGWYDINGIVCNEVLNVALDEDCHVTIFPDMIVEGNNVPNDLYEVVVFDNNVPIGNVVNGSHIGATLDVIVKNKCDNNTCESTLVIFDQIKPKLDCEPVFLSCYITNFEPDYLKNILGISAAEPTITDNCGIQDITYSDQWVTLGCNGTVNGVSDINGYVRRKWVAEDPSGNVDSCVQFLYFKEIGLSDVQLPVDFTLTNCTNPDTTPVNTGMPFVINSGIKFPLYPFNNFCGVLVEYEDQILPACGGSRTVLRAWTIFDACAPTVQGQNPRTFVQAINIVDNGTPEVICPADMTVDMTPLDCCAPVNLPDVVVTDACSAINDATAVVTTSGGGVLFSGAAVLQPVNTGGPNDTLAVFGTTSCLPGGTHNVQYTIEDKCTLISTCNFTLTVVDNTTPVAACDEFTNVSITQSGMSLVNASTFDDGSWDNCGFIAFKARRRDENTCQLTGKFYDQVKFCCEDVGDTIYVVLRVYDVAVPAGEVSTTLFEDNSNDCEVAVYVEDNIKPQCVPPANVTVSCENFDPSLWAYGFASGVDNCCGDSVTVQTSYANFDTICSRGTINRTFRAFDCQGNNKTCSQRIVVTYEQDFYIRFPDDVTVADCDDAGNYGQPVFFGEDCELLAVSHTDEVFTVVPDACVKLERTWTVINWCTYDPNQGFTFVPNPNPNAQPNHPTNLTGPTVSPQGTPAPWAPTVVKLNPNDPSPTNFSTFWNPATNSYKYKQIIKISDNVAPQVFDCPDTTVLYCDLTNNNPNLWNQPYWFDPLANMNDLCEGPAPLSVEASDLCAKANVDIRFLLFLDLDNNGTMETVISSTNPPTPGTVNFNNANTPNYGGGISRIFDNRPISVNQKYRWAIQFATSGAFKTANLRWNSIAQSNNYVIPELPFGVHKIKWIITDGCGNERICEYKFEVKDCKPATVTCNNGLSVNIGPDLNVKVFIADFIADAEDNCTPDSLLEFSFRKAGTGVGYPEDNNGNPITSLDFGCWAVDTQVMEVWVRDLAGNVDRCSTYIVIQDPSGFCTTNINHVSVAGALLTEDIDGLEDGYVEIQGTQPGGVPFSLFQMTNDLGNFKFSDVVPISGNYTITPTKDDNHLNGVTTYDLVLISQHILGIQPLGSPYKMIAADANKNGSITTIDIVELRRLILGIIDDLPNNTAWRFIDKSFVFPDMNNPFMTDFPEVKTVTDIQNSKMDENFVAVKVGDVNGTSVPNSLMDVDERSSGVWNLDVMADKVKGLQAGDVTTVRFFTDQPVLGYQFTLIFPELDVLDVQAVRGVTEDNFGVFEREHAITTSWFGSEPVEFLVTFRAKSAGDLNQMLTVSNSITKSEAYSQEGDKLDVQLRYGQQDGAVAVGVGFELYQNIPNPFINKTVIGFNLPEATEATLTVYDEMSRVIHQENGRFGKGYNTIAIESSKLNSAGLLYYKVETATDSAVRTMIRVR
jgi:hypothetical protein